MIVALDLWDTPMPQMYHNSNGGIKYKWRIMWCGLHYIEHQPFYAREIVQIIDDVYSEKLHTYTVSSFLKKLCSLGYIERIPLVFDSAQFKYNRTQLFRNFWRGSG